MRVFYSGSYQLQEKGYVDVTEFKKCSFCRKDFLKLYSKVTFYNWYFIFLKAHVASNNKKNEICKSHGLWNVFQCEGYGIQIIWAPIWEIYVDEILDRWIWKTLKSKNLKIISNRKHCSKLLLNSHIYCL